METLLGYVQKIGMQRLAILGGICLSTFAFFLYIITRANEPEMGLLFANIDPVDGSKIVERLKAMNIPNEVRGEGDQIYVPTENISKLRMELASNGLPAGGTIGYEIFDQTDILGTTHALMDINFLRATEGELAKSIRTVQGVQSARVHLVIPKRELFSSEKPDPSASILIKMKGSSRLSVNQVLAIQHLVASAVPSLSLDKISIIDDKGTLLAKGQDSSLNGDSLSSQQEKKDAYEAKLARSIESLLERTVGAGKLRAEVSAEMNFDKITSTSVEFNPDGQVARSVQTSSDGSNSNEASTSDAISVQNALPDATTGQPGAQSKNQDTHNEESTAYEISNTTRTHISEFGNVKRLSIAVLVDGTYVKGKDGKEVYTARSAAELAQLNDLVKTAVGYDEKRGDSVKVINMQFTEVPEIVDQTSTFEKLMNAIFRPKVINILLMLGSALLLFYTIIKPMAFKLSGIQPAPAKTRAQVQLEQQLAEEGVAKAVAEAKKAALGEEYDLHEQSSLDDMISIENIDGRMNTSSIKKIGEIIEKHPEEAVSIIRSWMYTTQQ